MDLTIRDWMVIIGVLLIVAVGLDAWRRVRKERSAGRVKMKLADPEEQGGSDRDADLAWFRELPNGGARVVQRRDLIRTKAAAAGGIAGQEHDQAGEKREQSPPQASRSAQAAPTW